MRESRGAFGPTWRKRDTRKRRRNLFITGLLLAALIGGAGASASQAARSTSATGVAIDSKGRIVVDGVANGRIALARHKPSGKLDHSFGSGGKATSRLARPIERGGRTIAIDSTGRIVVAGDAKSGFAAVRFKADEPSTAASARTGSRRATCRRAEGRSPMRSRSRPRRQRHGGRHLGQARPRRPGP